MIVRAEERSRLFCRWPRGTILYVIRWQAPCLCQYLEETLRIAFRKDQRPITFQRCSRVSCNFSCHHVLNVEFKMKRKRFDPFSKARPHFEFRNVNARRWERGESGPFDVAQWILRIVLIYIYVTICVKPYFIQLCLRHFWTVYCRMPNAEYL